MNKKNGSQNPVMAQSMFMGQQPQKRPQVPKQSVWTQSIQQLNRLLVLSKNVLVLVSPTQEFDSLLPGLAIAQSLGKIGRTAYIVSTNAFDPNTFVEKAQNDLNILEGINTILPAIPMAQLTITINYENGSFSHGSTDTTDQGLVLTLHHDGKNGPIEPLNIDSKNIHVKPNIAISVGIQDREIVEKICTEGEQFFKQIPLVNIDNSTENKRFGTVNLLDTKASSLSELVTLMLYDLRFVIDATIAKKLYAGMKEKTNNFSQEYFSPNLLEAASICMRYQQRPSLTPQMKKNSP